MQSVRANSNISLDTPPSPIKITSREMDIIACVLSGRTSKTIASFLSISPKTVETHIRSIMLKLECNSRDGIVNFIEKSGQLPFVKNRYQELLIKADFLKKLDEIRTLINLRAPPLTCLLYYNREDDSTSHFSLINEIESYLTRVGLNAISDKASCDRHLEKREDECLRVFYAIPLSQENKEISEFLQRNKLNPEFLTFLLWDENIPQINPEFPDIDFINCNAFENPYLLFFRILTHLFPKLELEETLSEFKKHYELIHKGTAPPISDYSQGDSRKETLTSPFFALANLKFMKLGTILIGIFGLMIWLWSSHKIHWIRSAYEPQAIIRSNLIIPTDNVLLKRSKIMSQMEKKLNMQHGIQTVVLIGIGGAGKTTLGRQFLRIQKFPVAWEINAETKDALVSSFEHLAYAISKTPEEKEEVNSLSKLEDSQERARRVLLLVKKKLKEHPNWCLLFDNVNRFAEIKEFYPHDIEVWGEGKVIITTRDINITNNNYIKSSVAINIEELDESDIFTLFMNILSDGKQRDLSSSEKMETLAFLSKLPPFPLDVSTAAYYIKDTKISYEAYLERLQSSNTDFERAQETILQEIGDYTKTRYGIITLTLKSLLEKNPNYFEPLLFITLLDSQDIPKNLLEMHSSQPLVEQLIHDLRKHSLITTQVSTTDRPPPAFSIHRSTQEIGLNYLKNNINPDLYTKASHDITKTMAQYTDAVLDKYDTPEMILTARHAEAFLSHGKVLNEITKKKSDSTIDLLLKLGVIHRQLGNSERSRELLYSAYHSCKELHSANHVKAGSIRVLLGSVYRNLGQYEKARTLLEEGLDVLKLHYDANHERIGWALVPLGSVYRALGLYEKSKNLLEHSLILHKKYYGPNHERTGWVLVDLGNTHKKLGNYQKALDLLQQSIAIHKTNFNETHVETGWALVHLGDVHRSLGHYEQAKSLLEQGLTVLKQHYGENHVMTGWALINLGKAYQSSGDNQKAREFFEKGFSIYKAHYKEDHIKFAGLFLWLGHNHLATSDIERAEALFKESVRLYTKYSSPELYLALEALAQLYVRKSQLTQVTEGIEKSKTYKRQAAAYLEHALKIVKNSFPAESIHITHIQSEFDKMANAVAASSFS